MTTSDDDCVNVCTGARNAWVGKKINTFIVALELSEANIIIMPT